MKIKERENTTMKKLLAILMAAVLLSMSLTACGGAETESAEDTAAAPVETEAETEAETEPETEKETEPPKPKMIEVFTPVYEATFDDASAPGWKSGNQCADFKVENGMLSVTATGGDSNILCSSKFELNCDDIDAIRIKYINNTSNDMCQLFFTTDASNTAYSEPGSYKEYAWFTDSGVAPADAAASEEWNEIVIYTEFNDLWTGTLKDVRIDLSAAEGSYIIDSIDFCTVTMVEEPAA